MQTYLGAICILAAAISWSFIGSISRFALADGLTPIEVAFWRLLIAGTFFMVHSIKIKDYKIQSRKDFLGLAIFGACGVALQFTAYFTVVQLGGAAIAAVLLYTAPAWVALFDRIIYGEPLTLRKVLAISISLAGVICISLSGNGFGNSISLVAIALGLLTGILYASHYVVTKYYLVRYTPLTIYGVAMLTGAAALLPFVEFTHKTTQAWLSLLGLGLLTGYIAYWLYCEGIRRLPMTKAAVIATLEPVMATILAWIIWGENFAPVGWVGTSMIIAAVFILVLEKKPELAGQD